MGTLTFKIQIRNIMRPPVWRRIQIPDNFTFHDLHLTIQKAFGWENEHLYQFQKQPYDRGWTVCESDREADFGFDFDSIDARETLVAGFLNEKKIKKMVYIYDFGDDWIHDMTLEKTDADKTLDHPVCTDGKGACPPEDCGGPWGYEEMKRLLAEEPDDDETQSYMEWLGLDDPREFDPTAFDRIGVNDSLKRLKATPVGKGKGKSATKSAATKDFLQPDFLKILDKMKDQVEKIRPEDREEFEDLMAGKTSLPDIENQRFYRYKKPDYEARAAKQIAWLGPFWNAEHGDDKVELCRFVEDDAKSMKLSRRDMADELRGYMNRLFARFDPKAPGNRWRLLGPLWMMERMGMDDLLDVALEALRQDAHFVYAYILRYEEWLAAAIYQLGHRKPEVLERFLYEQGVIPSVKPVVMNALVWTLLRHPEQRLRITAMIVKFMNHCLDICLKGASPMNLEQYAITLATAHVHETLPTLRRIFTELQFPTAVLDDGIDEIERVMNDKKQPFCCKYSSIDDYLNDQEELAQMDFSDEIGLFDMSDAQNDEDDEDLHEDIDGIYDTSEKAKRYELQIEHGREMRLLQVPSNMTLTGVTELTMAVFGRMMPTEPYELQSLLDNEFRFLSDADDHALESDYWSMDGTDYSTLSELLAEKDETAELRLKNKKKVVDTFTLTLKKIGRYTKRTPHPIDLLQTDDQTDRQAIGEAVRRFEADHPVPPADR